MNIDQLNEASQLAAALTELRNKRTVVDSGNIVSGPEFVFEGTRVTGAGLLSSDTIRTQLLDAIDDAIGWDSSRLMRGGLYRLPLAHFVLAPNIRRTSSTTHRGKANAIHRVPRGRRGRKVGRVISTAPRCIQTRGAAHEPTPPACALPFPYPRPLSSEPSSFRRTRRPWL